jgi:hypothetical protein
MRGAPLRAGPKALESSIPYRSNETGSGQTLGRRRPCERWAAGSDHKLDHRLPILRWRRLRSVLEQERKQVSERQAGVEQLLDQLMAAVSTVDRLTTVQGAAS